jgi:hypothetical protein
LLVLGSAGVSPQGFGGRDLRSKLLAHRRKEGSFDRQIAFTAFGILALRATGTPASSGTIKAAAAFLARQQEKKGGWNYYRRGGEADVDDTGAVLQALGAAGKRKTKSAKRGAAWLVKQQHKDGGFAGPGGGSNSQSTAFAVQGLVAAGRNPDKVRRSGRSPLTYLRKRIRADGSVAYSASSRQTPVWVTAQAVLALRKRALPIAAVPRHKVHGPSPAASSAAAATPSAAPSSGASAAAKPAAARKARIAAAPAASLAISPDAALLVRSIGALSGFVLAPFSMRGR